MENIDSVLSRLWWRMFTVSSASDFIRTEENLLSSYHCGSDTGSCVNRCVCACANLIKGKKSPEQQ